MTLSDIQSNLEEIRRIAQHYECDMWHEENAILEGVFRDIADELDRAIRGIKDIKYMTSEDKYREVAQQLGIREYNVKWAIQDFINNVNRSHDGGLCVEEYKNSMTIEDMATIVHLYRHYGQIPNISIWE